MTSLERCARCRKPIGFSPIIITRVSGDQITVVHFLCGTPAEVKALYADISPTRNGERDGK